MSEQRICSKCGGMVSMKTQKQSNRVRRPDRGFDHVQCEPGKPENVRLSRIERREHRTAVHAAILREERLP